MKKLLAYSLCLLTAFACTGVKPDMQQEVLVDFCVAGTELVMEGEPDTKAQFPLDPSVENTIYNLWVLQYANDGRLVKAAYAELPNPVLSTTLSVALVRGQSSTVLVVANMGGNNAGDEDWPSGADFKWGEHGGGSLYALQHKLFSYSLENPQMPHMFMVGVTEMDIDDTPKTINMMLSRLACKFRVTIKSGSANTYSNVRLQMVGCPVRFSLFPNDSVADEYTSDMVEYAPQKVTGAGEYLGTDGFLSYYFYANENLSPDPARQTMIKVLATKGGREVSTTLPVSAIGTTFRNTYYNIQVTLK